MIDPALLNTVQDEVINRRNADGIRVFWPREEDGDEITYCNLAALAVAQGVGCHDLDSQPGKEPMTADAIYNLFRTSKIFDPKPMAVCQDLVNKGALIFGIAPSWDLHQGHGHICTLTPGIGDYSGRWNMHTPLCMNLGRSGTCFRSKGINWAFQIVPEFYMWGAG